MKVLAEIHRSEGVNVHGRTVYRTAIRGVIARGRALLLVHSAAVGDYKFPGGGLMEGESHEQALRRELREECGCELTRMGAEIGVVVEYNLAVEPEYDTFKMTSHYYECEVSEAQGEQQLDDYERALGFKPVWIGIDAALHANRALLGSPQAPGWLRREIFLLEYLQRSLPPSN
jgi:8-oxo-dGTP diphosphatase